eukprot:3840026-Prorocentrum_lima.AAC.1
MHAQPALWHDSERDGFPEWAPKALKGDIRLIGGHQPWEQNSQRKVQLAQAAADTPSDSRIR